LDIGRETRFEISERWRERSIKMNDFKYRYAISIAFMSCVALFFLSIFKIINLGPFVGNGFLVGGGIVSGVFFSVLGLMLVASWVSKLFEHRNQIREKEELGEFFECLYIVMNHPRNEMEIIKRIAGKYFEGYYTSENFHERIGLIFKINEIEVTIRLTNNEKAIEFIDLEPDSLIERDIRRLNPKKNEVKQVVLKYFNDELAKVADRLNGKRVNLVGDIHHRVIVNNIDKSGKQIINHKNEYVNRVLGKRFGHQQGKLDLKSTGSLLKQSI
jgi:hypothetical protein